VAGYDSRFTIT